MRRRRESGQVISQEEVRFNGGGAKGGHAAQSFALTSCVLEFCCIWRGEEETADISTLDSEGTLMVSFSSWNTGAAPHWTCSTLSIGYSRVHQTSPHVLCGYCDHPLLRAGRSQYDLSRRIVLLARVTLLWNVTGHNLKDRVKSQVTPEELQIELLFLCIQRSQLR